MKKFVAIALVSLLFPAMCFAGRMDVRKPAYEQVLNYESQGFSVKDDIMLGELEKGRSYYFNTQLTAGIEYFYHFQGDQGVNKINLVIFDENWKVVAQGNTEGEGKSIAVTLNPEWSGTFHVKATLVDCNAAFDYWFILAGYR